jgi:hypothetical protein
MAMTMQNSNEPGNRSKGTLFSRLHFYSTIGLATLALASCGGGGGGGGSTLPATTITSISPVGMVQATTRNIAITGTNFASGMTLSITSSQGTIPVTPTSITSTMMIASITISSAPTEHYVTVNILSNGTTVASTILGVASTSKTVANGIQNIFTNKCATCHASGGAVGGMDLSDATIGNSTGVIGITSVACSQKFRIAPGDPRRTSSVLIDRIMTAPASQSCNQGHPMPPSGSLPAVTAQDITDIIDWVAGGAH